MANTRDISSANPSAADTVGARGAAGDPPAGGEAHTVDASDVDGIAFDDVHADARRREMHASFNNRISYLCKLVALIIAVVAFATIALGQELPQFVLMGLCLSVALLALAMLQDHHQRRR